MKLIDRSHDEEIINLVQKIMGNGTFVIETINESILVGLMDKRGTPIQLDESAPQRDWKGDFKRFLDGEL
jgi:hypothetical protein